MKLTVVLISKNQEWNIRRLLQSVIDGTATMTEREIILIDSASDDRTVDYAKEFPVRIVRLHSDQVLTAAAGRTVGLSQTAGEYVLFLDGDMQLYRGWLEKATQYLMNHPEVAAITGTVIHLPQEAAADAGPSHSRQSESDVSEIPYGGGAALYRRSVLNQVGGFNPFIYSDEEPELCCRIRNAGYRIVRTGQPIADHFSTPQKTLRFVFGRWRRNLYLGAGQNLRYHLGSDVFWLYFKERAYGVTPILLGLSGVVAAAVLLMTGQVAPLVYGCLGLGLLFVGEVVRRRSLYRTLASLLERFCIADGTIRGFLMKSRKPEEYAAKFDIIQ